MSPRLPSQGPGHGGPASGAPPRGYRWEPFAPGNLASLRHGANSPRRVEPLAAELVEAAVEAVPYLAEVQYAGELAAWSRAEARVILLARYVEEHGPLDEAGEERPALRALHREERIAAERRHALGLTPMARAKLGRDVTAGALDLAKVWAQAEREEDRDAS